MTMINQLIYPHTDRSVRAAQSMNNTFIATTFNWDHRNPTQWQRLLNKVLRKLRIPAKVTPPQPHMANVEIRMNLFHLLEQTLVRAVPGDVVDLGCNAGESTIVMRKLLDAKAPEKQLHAFDSFEGLPELVEEDLNDGVYGAGYMSASLNLFKRNFSALSLKLPIVHKGWFEETVPTGLPEKICFALLDGDLYASTKHILPHVYERMPAGAIGMIAVYYDETLLPREDLPGGYRSPGVKRAVDEFFLDKPEEVGMLYANETACGYFRKL